MSTAQLLLNQIRGNATNVNVGLSAADKVSKVLVEASGAVSATTALMYFSFKAGWSTDGQEALLRRLYATELNSNK